MRHSSLSDARLRPWTSWSSRACPRRGGRIAGYRTRSRLPGDGISRLAKLRRVDGGVDLHIFQLRVKPAVQPKELVVERKLDPVHLAVIGVVDLRGNAPDRRRGISDHSLQQVGLRIEIERNQ